MMVAEDKIICVSREVFEKFTAQIKAGIQNLESLVQGKSGTLVVESEQYISLLRSRIAKLQCDLIRKDDLYKDTCAIAEQRSLEIENLREKIQGYEQHIEDLNRAFNEGDGSYHP